MSSETRIARRVFFLNPSRRPRWKIPKDYPQKNTDPNWSAELTKHGFMLPPKAGENTAVSDSMVKSINDVNDKLLPLFFDFDYQAKVNQNLFYFVQYTFVIGAFITTLLGALTVTTIPSAKPDTTVNTTTNQSASDNPTVAKFFGALTAIAGVLTGFATMIQNREKPQEKWYKYRRWAETLRMHYFEYLACMSPYDSPDRTKRLEGFLRDLRLEAKIGRPQPTSNKQTE
jgi:hypothetical protein